jgi:FkbM family methyltransferase
MKLKKDIHNLFKKFGYKIAKFSPNNYAPARCKQILDKYRIDTVIDIGANTGQFATELRSALGYSPYKNRIISFEPLSSAFKLLKERAELDPKWDVFNAALGDTDENTEINIAGNSYSSSLLDMLPSHIKSAPESKYVGREIIEVKRLDSIFDNLCKPNNRVFMKIDTQGYESKVLKGAEKSLLQIDTVQLEMSLVPLYVGELLFNEMCMLMSEKGYTLVAIDQEYIDQNSGQLLQVNGIFHRL